MESLTVRLTKKFKNKKKPIETVRCYSSQCSLVFISGLPREPLLEMLGEYYLTFLQKRGYGEILRNLGHNVLEFVQNLDSVHALVKRDYPDMVAPSFRCDADSSTDRMVLHYYSQRTGLYPIIKGVLH